MTCRQCGRTSNTVSTEHWLAVIARQRDSTSVPSRLRRVCSIRLAFLQSFVFSLTHFSHLLHCSRSIFQLGCNHFISSLISLYFLIKALLQLPNSVCVCSHLPRPCRSKILHFPYKHKFPLNLPLQNGICIWFCFIRAHRAGCLCWNWPFSSWLWYARFKYRQHGTLLY